MLFPGDKKPVDVVADSVEYLFSDAKMKGSEANRNTAKKRGQSELFCLGGHEEESRGGQ